jgi:hypothetical protein
MHVHQGPQTTDHVGMLYVDEHVRLLSRAIDGVAPAHTQTNSRCTCIENWQVPNACQESI